MYLLLLIVSYIILYYWLALWLQYFFNEKKQLLYKFYHSAIIVLLFLVVVVSTELMTNEIIWNRLLHAFWGWFIMIVVTLFSLKASQVKINKFQFLFLWFFIATTFWVVNELTESFWQIVLHYTFSSYFNDTWLDLWSNTVGAIVWLLVFVGFVGKKKK